MNSVLKVTILLGCSAATALTYAQTGVNSQGDGNVQEAIRYERAKDAADARQAAKEAGRAQPTPTAAAATANEQSRAGNVPDSGVQAAVRFERSKDAADARQARIESNRGTDTSVNGSADRRMTGHQ